jgi:hypothetical protein
VIKRPKKKYTPKQDVPADGTEAPVYEYSFTPVNLKDINAFALPGRPMFVHAACSTRRPKKRKSRHRFRFFAEQFRQHAIEIRSGLSSACSTNSMTARCEPALSIKLL